MVVGIWILSFNTEVILHLISWRGKMKTVHRSAQRTDSPWGEAVSTLYLHPSWDKVKWLGPNMQGSPPQEKAPGQQGKRWQMHCHLRRLLGIRRPQTVCSPELAWQCGATFQSWGERICFSHSWLGKGLFKENNVKTVFSFNLLCLLNKAHLFLGLSHRHGGSIYSYSLLYIVLSSTPPNPT